MQQENISVNSVKYLPWANSPDTPYVYPNGQLVKQT